MLRQPEEEEKEKEQQQQTGKIWLLKIIVLLNI